MTIGVWALGAGVVGAATYLLWMIVGGRREDVFDAGAVSQSWLIEHKASSERTS